MKPTTHKPSGRYPPAKCENVSSSGKRIERDGKFYRMRRGKLVEIPMEWVGKTVDSQTIRKRPSKKGRGKSFHHKFKNGKR